MGLSARLSVRARVASCAVIAAALAAATPGAGAPPQLKQKQAEAQQILAQVQSLDIQLGRLGEQLNGAKYELAGIRTREHANAAALAVAKQQYNVAERRLEARLVAVYESDTPTTVDAILGATTLSGVLDRIELVNAASSLDHRIAHHAAVLRKARARRAAALATERKHQAIVVASLASHQEALNTALGQRRVLLSSVQGEVQHLQAQEAARQARLAAAVRARLAAETRERARLARLARAKAAKAASTPVIPTPTPTTTTTPAVTTTTAPADTTTTPTTTSTETTPTSPAPPPIPSGGPGHPDAASLALQYLGVPYVFGGATPAGFDCSGLVMYVYAKLGISLPHYAAAQYTFGTPVARSALQPGDLIFFDSLNHVGISLGGNQFVHAPHTGDVVKIDSIVGWYADNYVGARRL